jgi:PAB1-binding protein PBP1
LRNGKGDDEEEESVGWNQFGLYQKAFGMGMLYIFYEYSNDRVGIK